MKLIDKNAYKQELVKALDRNLRMTGRSDPGVLTALKYAIAKLDSAPVVDAVPIDWLSNIAKLCKKNNDIYVQNYGTVIEILIKGWKEEREKQNDGI